MESSPREELSRLETLYAEHPEGRVFTHLAEAYRKAGDLERAHNVLIDGLEHHSDYPSAHVVLGRVLTDQGESDAARDAFKRVLELDPQNLVALRTLGDLARQGGRPDEAMRHYRELMRLDAGDDEIATLIANLESEATAGAAEETGGPDESGLEMEPTISASAESGLESEPTDALPEETELEGESPFAEVEGFASFDEPDAEPEGDGADAIGTPEPEPASSPMNEVETDPVPGFESSGMAGSVSEGEVEGSDEAGMDAAPDIDPDAHGEETETPSDDGLYTETMAELYARQGLYDRAAQIYRELLKVRPEDVNLGERLAEVERLEREQEMSQAPAEGEIILSPEMEASAPTPDEAALTLPSEDEAAPPSAPPSADLSEEDPLPELPEFDEEPLPQLPDESMAGGSVPEALEAAWTAADGVGGDEVTPYAWTEGSLEDEPDQPADGGATVRDYFRELLAWRPAGESAEVPANAAVDAAAAGETDVAGTPTTTHPSTDTPVTGAGAESSGAEDADDIEAFRDWLNSLKR